MKAFSFIVYCASKLCAGSILVLMLSISLGGFQLVRTQAIVSFALLAVTVVLIQIERGFTKKIRS